MFAIVRVYLDYDRVDYVECVGKFPTKRDAEQYIERKENLEGRSWKAFSDYVEKFIDEIDISDATTSNEKWADFHIKYLPFGSILYLPYDFKPSLRHYLLNGKPLDMEEYNPPEFIRENTYEMHIVEITVSDYSLLD